MQNTCLRTSAPNDGDVAQLGEHHVRNVGVVGSNPIISTIEIPTGQAIAWPVLFCMTKGFEPLRSIRVKKQPSGLFLANREEALADEVKRAKRDSESHHLHHVFSKAVLTNGLFICRCAEPQHSSLAFNRRSRTVVRVAPLSGQSEVLGFRSLSWPDQRFFCGRDMP